MDTRSVRQASATLVPPPSRPRPPAPLFICNSDTYGAARGAGRAGAALALRLHLRRLMKRQFLRHTRLAACAAALCLTLSQTGPAAGSTPARQNQNSAAGAATAQSPAAAAFEERVKAYVKLREGLEEKLPKLSKDSTAGEIEAHKKVFQETVRNARAGAKPGDVFTPDAAALVRAIIKQEFSGRRERAELRKMVYEADTKGVPLRVNYPYPESKELTEIPATLLQKLPALPKQVRYRFVNRHVLLVDRENGLILDYMLNALP